MKNKSVLFRVDDSSEMLEVYIGDKLWRVGNFWDFDFVEDAQALLEKAGVEVDSEDYNYED